ncbi:MAG: GNAT family N-acetyltransferase, partial [Lachnospiraceae bacterium]|nr:GNAT family N-acetyltransferase [Lachnospiraceae bacterium]
MNTEIIRNYRNQNELRCSFNQLACKTFDGLDFEEWYQNGYWSERYDPHSIVIDGKVVANVSVNFMDFLWKGQRKRFIQLGTVMTQEGFRNQGLIRQIMNEIEKEYGQKVDGIYLFANDSVLDFYPKFGFKKAMEYCYTKPFFTSRGSSVVQISMQERTERKNLEDAIGRSVSYSRFRMVDNDNLIFFYVTGPMQDCVYYDCRHDAYVIAKAEGHVLTVHDMFSKRKCPMDDLLASFGKEIRQVRFGFTPINAEG